ncbi:MAG: hypothetical protein ACPG7K_02480, partial [Poseidonia sp.]
LEEDLVDLHMKKKIHSETIKYAVNKSSEPPVINERHADDVISLALEQKLEFDAGLERRDTLVNRLLVPRHRVVHTLGEFYENLTTNSASSEPPSLAAEIEYFSRFFELQAMLKCYDDQQQVLSELNALRNSLLETIKSVNKNDRRLSQLIKQTRASSKEQRSEAGRLKAYLEKNNASPVVPVPPPTPEMGERLLAGEALSMEEFASMLEHGGLTELGRSPPSPSKPKQRKKNSMRKTQPLRGERQRSKRPGE